MSTIKVLTLKTIQDKLQVKQHVLIHLCEKGVIEPDIQQTEGRGSHRGFSERNLFEFGLALAIRNYQIPIVLTAAIIKLLRAFDRSMEKQIKNFNLVDYLVNPSKTLSIHLYLYEGHYLVFAVQQNQRWFPMAGFDLAKVLTKKSKEVIHVDSLKDLPENFDSYLHLDLKKIAKRTV